MSLPASKDIPEKFLWFSDVIKKPHELIVACGAGFCSMHLENECYATVAEMRAQKKPGMLGSATALLSVTDYVRTGFVMIERDAGASVDPLKWQFPAGRMGMNELPVTTACRELTEEVGLNTKQGEVINFRGIKINEGGYLVEFLTQDSIHKFKARFVILHNTVEFYYPMSLAVNSISNIIACDKEKYNRQVSLFSFEEVNEMSKNGLLTGSSMEIWRDRQSAI